MPVSRATGFIFRCFLVHYQDVPWLVNYSEQTQPSNFGIRQNDMEPANHFDKRGGLSIRNVFY